MKSFRPKNLKKEEIDYLRSVRKIKAYFDVKQNRVIAERKAFFELLALDEALS